MMPAADDLLAQLFTTSRVVYGYLRPETPDELEIAAWRKDMAHFCREAGYRLAGVFIDRGVPHDCVKRPGLGGLLDVLALPETYGLVVPGIEHLSRDQATLMVLGLLISRTDAHIIVMARA
jgi:DNA invertase Pin-like site-specific DNA recombinase